MQTNKRATKVRLNTIEAFKTLRNFFTIIYCTYFFILLRCTLHMFEFLNVINVVANSRGYVYSNYRPTIDRMEQSNRPWNRVLSINYMHTQHYSEPGRRVPSRSKCKFLHLELYMQHTFYQTQHQLLQPFRYCA